MSMFLQTPSTKFIPDRKYEVLIPPSFNQYVARLNYRNRANNAWIHRVSDVIVSHDGKVFVGGGDYDINSGVTPISSYNPTTKEWTVEALLTTEQISSIYEANDTLWIPCVDHTGGDTDSTVYKRNSDGTWQTISIPYATQHSFNIISWGGRLWMDSSLYPSPGVIGVVSSSDGGQTWEKIICYEYDGVTPATAAYDVDRLESGFLPLGDDLYAINRVLPVAAGATGNMVYKYDSISNTFIRVAERFNGGVNVSGDVLWGRYRSSMRDRTTFAFTSTLLTSNRFMYVGEFNGTKFVCLKGYQSNHYNGGPMAVFSTANTISIARYDCVSVNCFFVNSLVSKKFVPAIDGYAEGATDKYDAPTGIRYYSLRDVVGVCMEDGTMFVLQVSTDNFVKFNGDTYLEQLNVAYTVSIWSTTDLVNYRLRFKDKFPVQPSCFTVLGNHAYLSLMADFFNHSSMPGSIIKAKMSD